MSQTRRGSEKRRKEGRGEEKVGEEGEEKGGGEEGEEKGEREEEEEKGEREEEEEKGRRKDGGRGKLGELGKGKRNCYKVQLTLQTSCV